MVERAGVLCWCCLLLVCLQPCATFHGAALPAIPHARAACAALAAHPPARDVDVRASGVESARRQFVVGSSLLLGGSLVAVPGLCSAEDAPDAEEEEEELAGGDGPPTWAVDSLEVPVYAADKAWMWRDLREGNIVKANTKLSAEDIYYPQWMFGLWQVESTARCVEAPLVRRQHARVHPRADACAHARTHARTHARAETDLRALSLLSCWHAGGGALRPSGGTRGSAQGRGRAAQVPGAIPSVSTRKDHRRPGLQCRQHQSCRDG